MKDNFSTSTANYAKYRPSYPMELVDHIVSLVNEKENAWDCGTGNGQLAQLLASHFQHIEATDISEKQLAEANHIPNIQYSVQPAENTNFPDNHFDLITVAQAIHWFDFEKFYQEAKRTIKEGGIMAIVGYALLKVNPAVDAVIGKFYHEIVGSYWDPERRYIDEHYQTIPFPLKEIESPHFLHASNWTLEELLGYLETWSAVKHFMKKNNYNPINDIRNELINTWGDQDTLPIHFPILLRTGQYFKHSI